MRRSRKFPELPRSVTEARAIGSSRYFTGKPCPQGHIAPKSVSNQRCVECDRIRLNARRAKLRAPLIDVPNQPLYPPLETPFYIAAHLTRGWIPCIAGRVVVDNVECDNPLNALEC